MYQLIFDTKFENTARKYTKFRTDIESTVKLLVINPYSASLRNRHFSSPKYGTTYLSHVRNDIWLVTRRSGNRIELLDIIEL